MIDALMLLHICCFIDWILVATQNYIQKLLENSIENSVFRNNQGKMSSCFFCLAGRLSASRCMVL